MKKIISRVFASLMTGLLVTVAICVIMVFYVMFTIPDEELVNKSLLFGIISVETIKEDGGFSLTMQTGNPLAFLCVWLVISVLIFLITTIYHQLTKYKTELLARQNTNNSSANELVGETTSESTGSSPNTTVTNQQATTQDNNNSDQT